jgi:5-(carboxyamino)imidazole ribonucleotide synthase
VAASAVPPGRWLGVLGGGQLGRMFCHAAQRLGYRVCVLDPDPDSPAGAVAEQHLQADYLDESALDALASRCAAVTTEFENVPAAALRRLAATVTVCPSADAVAVAQDRIDEKTFVAGCGIAVAPYAVVRGEADLSGVDPALFPGILKAARLGYDGKGQARVADAAQALAAYRAFGSVPCVLERALPLAAEVSVVVARALDGRTVAWPAAENLHRDGILARTVVPARVPEATARSALDAARRIAEALGYAGVLCVEFFVLADGALVVNEMAPRPHNSGHWTIDASVTSQFEQQARVLAGLPLGATDALAPAVMVNLLGDCWLRGAQPAEPDWAAVLADPRVKLHLYGKAQPRRGRKMGHLTVVGGSAQDCLQAAMRAERLLGIA